MNRHLVGSNYERSSIKIAHFIPIRWQTWSPQTILGIMFTLTLQISKLTKAVVLNSFPHGRFWHFVYKENVRCTRLMQRSLQVVKIKILPYKKNLSPQAIVSFKKYMPPSLPYFKVNICSLPLPHFASILCPTALPSIQNGCCYQK
jgi:hypothetical protein